MLQSLCPESENLGLEIGQGIVSFMRRVHSTS